MGDDPSQVVYVWIDALVNYIAGLGYPDSGDFRAWWNTDADKVHVIGRNVWKFHAVYWPALLLSAGLPLPDELIIHGFLTADGRKISKSLGNAPAPEPLIARYGSDALRYFLLRLGSPFEDGDFSQSSLAATYEADLVNGLGNLVSRILSLAVKSGLQRASHPATSPVPAEFVTACAECRPDEALAILWRQISALDRAIEAAKPWELLRNGSLAEAAAVIEPWLSELATLGVRLEAFLPATAKEITKALAADPLRTILPLFPRIRSDSAPFQ